MPLPYHLSSLLGRSRVTGTPPGRGTGAETLGPSCRVEGVFTLLIDSPAPEGTSRDLTTVLSQTSPLGRVEGRARGTHGVICITEGGLVHLLLWVKSRPRMILTGPVRVCGVCLETLGMEITRECPWVVRTSLFSFPTGRA